MVAAESALPDDRRVDFVSIVSRTAITLPSPRLPRRRFNVICDKPMTTSLKAPRPCKRSSRKRARVFALTHYTGYPWERKPAPLPLRRARRITRSSPSPTGLMVTRSPTRRTRSAAGAAIPRSPAAPAAWATLARTPTTSCATSRLEIEDLCADLTNFVPSNQLEDDGNVLIHMKAARAASCSVHNLRRRGNPLASTLRDKDGPAVAARRIRLPVAAQNRRHDHPLLQGHGNLCPGRSPPAA